MKKKFCIILFFFLNEISFSQWSIKNILLSEIPTVRNLEKENFSDSLSVIKKLEHVQYSFYSKGFIASSFDSLYIAGKIFYIIFNTGKNYSNIQISIPDSLAAFANYRNNIPLNEVEKYINDILTYCEENGYPFAHAKIDAKFLNDSLLQGTLLFFRDKKFIYDTLDYGGENIISKNFLSKYLNLQKNKLYNEKDLKVADTRINRLNGVETSRPAIVYFIDNKVRPVFFLQRKKSNQIDGILGLSPASEVTGEKLLLTGELHLKLYNMFERGVDLEADYRSFRGSSQDFKLRNVVPYIFGTQLGSDVTFGMLKYDSNYINVTLDAGLQYLFSGSDYIKFSYKNDITNLLFFDTAEAVINKHLPQFNSTRSGMYGIGIKFSRLNYNINPRKGWQGEMNFFAGTKKIIEIDTLKKLGLYDDVKTSSLQYRFSFFAEKYFAVKKSSAIKINTMSSGIYAPVIFYNELFRIGGIRTLRGFDEQSIFASTYIVGNMEYRYLINKNSNALAFFNCAWYENKSITGYKTDTPFGFGIGANLQTANGIFSIYYALGSQHNNPIALKSGKIHFGFVNTF